MQHFLFFFQIESENSELEESEEEVEQDIHWFWAGDSKAGKSQDIWVEYDPKMAKKIERSYQKGESEVKIDSERFLDLDKMLQRRYDDTKKRRAV